MNDITLIDRLLDVIEHDIVPKTRAGVTAGNKLFGAAILRRSDLSVVVAETNNELENPLWHGEMHALKRFYELPAEARPATRDCLFLTTHEPCSLCLSAITWSGFDNFYYFFTYEDSRDAFAIPHDLKILDEVFRLPDGRYNPDNAFWKSWSIKAMAADTQSPERERLAARIATLAADYAAMSEIYQEGKQDSDIPLA